MYRPATTLRTAAIALALAIAGASCADGDPTSPQSPGTPSPSAEPSTDPTPTPSEPEGPSQSAEDAARDGVVPELAALPFDVRVDVIASVDTDEGIWAISRPTAAADDHATEGCRLGAIDGVYPTDFICTFEYGEVLLLSSDGRSILHAFPLPSVPPEQLVATDDAVYCARKGGLPLTDAMACRIDRRTLEPTVMIFPDPEASTVVQPCFYPPDTWTIVDELIGAEELVVDEAGAWLREADGTWVQLDPVTLELVARGTSGPG